MGESVDQAVTANGAFRAGSGDVDCATLLRGKRGRALAFESMLLDVIVYSAFVGAFSLSLRFAVALSPVVTWLAIRAFIGSRRIDVAHEHGQFTVQNIEDLWVFDWADVSAIYSGDEQRRSPGRTRGFGRVIVIELRSGTAVEVRASAQSEVRSQEFTRRLDELAAAAPCDTGPTNVRADGTAPRRLPTPPPESRTRCTRLALECSSLIAVYGAMVAIIARTLPASIMTVSLVATSTMWAFWRSHVVGVAVVDGRLIVRNFLSYANVPIDAVVAVDLGHRTRTAIGSLRGRTCLRLSNGHRIPVDASLRLAAADRDAQIGGLQIAARQDNRQSPLTSAPNCQGGSETRRVT